MPVIRVTVLLALLALLGSCASMDTESNIQKAGAHYKIGVGYLYENKIQLAFVEFQRAYELQPGNKEVLNAIGIIYMQHYDDTVRAIEFFQKAVQADPDYSEAYNNLGYAHSSLGKYEAAIPFYKKAVTNLLYTTPEKAFINMGRAYYRLGRIDDAVASYKEAIKRAPSLDLPYFGLALCYNAMRKYGDASAALSQAIVLNPQFRGSSKAAAEDFAARKASAPAHDQKDLSDYLEILKY